MHRLDFLRAEHERGVAFHFGQPPGEREAPRGDAAPEEPHRPHADAQLFAKLAHQGRLFAFARFAASAGEAVFSRRPHMPRTADDEQLVLAHDDAGDTVAKLVWRISVQSILLSLSRARTEATHCRLSLRE